MVNDFLPPKREGQPLHGNRGPSFNVHRSNQFTPPRSQDPLATTAEVTPEPTQPQVHPNGAVTGGHPSFGPKPKRSFKERLANISKKQWIIIVGVAVLLLGGGGAAAFVLLSKDEPKKQVAVTQEETPAPEPVSTTVASNLTGLQVDPSVNRRPVTGIMIENSQDARPQSGLLDAGVIFEAVAEGGITRFATIFQDNLPEYVGPVRSVRPYYVQWYNGFDAAIAHVGGSPDGLALVRKSKDLDQFFNASAYWRVSNRFAPHNMYTSLPKLNEVEAKKGWTSSNYTPLVRKAKETPSQTPTAKSIDFNISGAIYNSHYDYDAPTNTYKRSEGGKPHTDEKTGSQLAPKVVIGLVVPQGKNGVYTTYQTIGSGQVVVFQDGIATEGTWSKASDAAQFTFKDSAGAELKLNPGQTWFTVLGSRDRITFAP